MTSNSASLLISIWEWETAPEYDAFARKIAEGKLDRQKQDALYVRIGGDGRAFRPPPIAAGTIDSEKERLSGFRYLLEDLIEGREATYRYERVIATVKEMFDSRVL